MTLPPDNATWSRRLRLWNIRNRYVLSYAAWTVFVAFGLWVFGAPP